MNYRRTPPHPGEVLKESQGDLSGTMSADLVEWGAMPPVGREFGSPDYERLEKLDALALEVLGSMKKARGWLDAPHPELEGLTPEESARTATGYRQVMRLLRGMHKARKQAKAARG